MFLTGHRIFRDSRYMEQKKAIIAGATGLVGSHLLDLLLNSDSYEKVYVLNRRKIDLEHPKAEELVIDFDSLPYAKLLPEADDVYCCLGTTMKKAGSKDAFRKVDQTYPFEIAKQALDKGASQYFLVSAMGADDSSFFFYNRVKGEAEQSISKLSAYRNVSIYRPSLILGEREEERAGERIATKLMRFLKPLMIGPLRKYRPIQARTIANSMYNTARQQQRGVQIYESEQIKSLAGELTVSQS